MEKATEPIVLQNRFNNRGRSHGSFHKAELNAVLGHEALVLATAIGHAIINGLEKKEKRRVRRTLLLIVSGIVTFVGVTELAIQLIKS